MQHLIDTLKAFPLEAINPDNLRCNRSLLLHISSELKADRDILFFTLSLNKALTAYYNIINGRKIKGIAGKYRAQYAAKFWADMEKAGFEKVEYYRNHHYLFHNNSKTIVKVRRDNPLLKQDIVKNTYTPRKQKNEDGTKTVIKPKNVQRLGDLEIPYYPSKKKAETGDHRLYSSYNRASKLCRAIVADLQGVDSMTEFDGKSFALQLIAKATGSSALMKIIESGLPYGVEKSDKDYDKRKKQLLRNVNILASTKHRDDLRIRVRVMNNGKYEYLKDENGDYVYRTDENGNYILAKSTEEKKAAALRWLSKFFDRFYKPQLNHMEGEQTEGAADEVKELFLAVCKSYTHAFLTAGEEPFRKLMKTSEKILGVHDAVHIPSSEKALIHQAAQALTGESIIFGQKSIDTFKTIDLEGEKEKHRYDALRKRKKGVV